MDGSGGDPGPVAGLVLAAGGGRRAGGPKALRRDADGTWLARACLRLSEAGCAPVLAVLGAGAVDARSLLPPGVLAVVAPDWAEGASRSLEAGLDAAARLGAAAVVVTLVDLPDERTEAVRRVLGAALGADGGPAHALVRAVYGGLPGHPVAIGARHWVPLRARLVGDAGGREYLALTPHRVIECGDLGGGDDVDGPHDSTSPSCA